MFVALLFTLLALPGLLIVWSVRSLAVNRAKARESGFPTLERWVSPMNPLWLMYGSSIVKASRTINIGTSNFWRFYQFGWEANQRHWVHQEIGSVFMLVTPGGNWLCVNDAEVINDILQRRTEFRRNLKQIALLAVFGDNLATTDGEEGQKHRKVTAITFTEKNNELVWKNSLAQAQKECSNIGSSINQ